MLAGIWNVLRSGPPLFPSDFGTAVKQGHIMLRRVACNRSLPERACICRGDPRMRRRFTQKLLSRAIIGFLAFVSLLFAPPLVTRPSFDVVSIRPNATNGRLYYKSFSTRFTATNMTAKQLLLLSRRIQSFQLSGGEGWFSSQGFDIEAKTDRPVNWAEMQLMLQSLLEDRFRLTIRHQTREAPIYMLVPGKGGVKIKLSSDQTLWTGDHPNEPGTTGANMDISEGSLSGDSIPMAMFVSFLSQQVGRTVINKTGLTGRYAIELRWAPDRAIGPFGEAGASASTDSSEASFFTAVQEQLGLRLESGRAPVDFFVIDHIEKPSEN